jgi:hypothetical protein
VPIQNLQLYARDARDTHLSNRVTGCFREKIGMRDFMGSIVKQFRVLCLVSALTTFANTKTLGAADTFAAAKLTKKEITQLIPVLQQLAYDIPDSWNTELRAWRVDLGNRPGLVLEGTNLLCGGTGNCQIFVFRNVNEQWVSLFQAEAPIGDTFTFGPDTTNGIKDLNVASNQSAQTEHRARYRFDGQFYRSK